MAILIILRTNGFSLLPLLHLVAEIWNRRREESPGAQQRGESGEGGGHGTAQGESTNEESASCHENIWRGAQPKSGEPTVAEEMDKYFDDMFL